MQEITFFVSTNDVSDSARNDVANRVAAILLGAAPRDAEWMPAERKYRIGSGNNHTLRFETLDDQKTFSLRLRCNSGEIDEDVLKAMQEILKYQLGEDVFTTTDQIVEFTLDTKVSERNTSGIAKRIDRLLTGYAPDPHRDTLEEIAYAISSERNHFVRVTPCKDTDNYRVRISSVYATDELLGYMKLILKHQFEKRRRILREQRQAGGYNHAP